MPTNEEIITKAISSGMLATGGQLFPEQAKTFIDYVVDETKIFKNIQFRRMNNFKAETYEIGIGKRLLRKGIEGTEPDNIPAITTSKRMIELEEVILPIDITDRFKLENVEGESIEDKILRLFTKQFSNDLEDLALNADKNAQNTNSSGDSYFDVTDGEIDFLSIINGWVKILSEDSDANIVMMNYSETDGWKKVFKSLLAALPKKFKGNKKGLVYYCDEEILEEYEYAYFDRGTINSDKALLEGMSRLTYAGIPIEGVPSMPSGNIILTPPENLAFGIHNKDIKIESERKARKRADEYTITAYVGTQIANLKGAVFGKIG